MAATVSAPAAHSRHSAIVRITHWITTACFLAMLVSGVEILISHPRFYWGEAGAHETPPLFQLPIPASRASVKTGYNFVLRDQNSWSRSLHFQAAWALVFTGLAYFVHGLRSKHFRQNLLPERGSLSVAGLASQVRDHLRFRRQGPDGAYNVLQRLAYLKVIFVLFPLIVWTGLAMSPAFVAEFPSTASILGGQQSARTIHFFVTISLVIFLAVHLVMIAVAGFRTRVRAMITGRAS